MKKTAVMMIVLVLLLFATSIGLASMRCGNLIVEEGTNGMEIQAECGEPVAKEKYFIDKYGDVDKWVYGPDAGYLYVIYLFMGKVVEIEEIQQ